MKKKQILLVVGLVALMVISAIRLSRLGTREWTEDVALDDGTVLTIKRYVKLTESNSLAGDAYSVSLRKVALAFEAPLEDLPTWTELLTPLLLYRDSQTSEWVVVAATSSCDVWYSRGKPNPPYWEYRLRNGQWKEGPLSEFSKGRASNLFYNYAEGVPSSHLNSDGKTKRLLEGSEKYRGIVATPFDFICSSDFRPH